MLQTLIILLDAIILFLFFRAMYRKILMTPINKFVEKYPLHFYMLNEGAFQEASCPEPLSCYERRSFP